MSNELFFLLNCIKLLVAELPILDMNWVHHSPIFNLVHHSPIINISHFIAEEIGVDVEFSNPLQVPIDVSSVCLTCEFDDSNAKNPGKITSPGGLTDRKLNLYQVNM